MTKKLLYLTLGLIFTLGVIGFGVSNAKAFCTTCEQDNLSLSFVCSTSDEQNSRWQVNNPTSADMPFTWETDNGSGAGIALAQAVTDVQTDFVSAGDRMTIRWELNGVSHRDVVLAKSNCPCPEVSPTQEATPIPTTTITQTPSVLGTAAVSPVVATLPATGDSSGIGYLIAVGLGSLTVLAIIARKKRLAK